ncbi:dihydrodipicolinate synthase family protein [Solihabitans fulvus]|uniref:Dihydrodipicolinate synthase family protein n=1 Tax=Solihabitans fulvus TaxID=1892852 RepID=A0A5B2X6G2_9PSEU|nr:dihydrodipicolinate synthase family protein [Solihabitans fulvus]KAA2258721.1 dihydrodipicolinate synthase family protein [Solihabitans fulvus]
MTYKGTIVPLVTPLDAGGAVSEKSVDRLIEEIGDEVTGLMPALSSGEGWKLTEQQWIDVVSYTIRHSRGLPVLAGVQLPDTASVIARARTAVDLGVDAIVVSTPFGGDVTQDEIVEHYRAVREAVGVGIFVYNEEAVSGNRAELDTLLRVCRLPGIVGIKESSGSTEFTRALLAAEPGVPVFEGWENLLIDTVGVQGFIGPLANLEPAVCNAMLAEPTKQRQEEIDDLCRRFGIFEDTWYKPVKAELVRRGVIETDLTAGEEQGATP